MSTRGTIACAVALAASVPLAGVSPRARGARATGPRQPFTHLDRLRARRPGRGGIRVRDPARAGGLGPAGRADVRPRPRTAHGKDTRRSESACSCSARAVPGTPAFRGSGPASAGSARTCRTGSTSSASTRAGIARSSPVMCSAALLAKQPSPIMKSQADFDATVRYNRRLRAGLPRRAPGRCSTTSTPGRPSATWMRSGRPSGESTADVPRKLVRTLLGAAVRRDLPATGSGRWSWRASSTTASPPGTFLDTQAAAAQDSFDEFVKWCDRTNDLRTARPRRPRAVGGPAGAGGPRRGRRPERPGARDRHHSCSSFTVFRALYGPEWAGLATILRELDSAAPPSSGTPSRPLPIPTTLAVFCQDWNLPVRDYREYAGTCDRLAPDTTRTCGTQVQLIAVTNCLGAPPRRQPAAPAGGPRPRHAAPADQRDPRPGHRLQLGDQRGPPARRHGVLLTYEGWGHGSYNSSACAKEAVDRYLISQELPPGGARCRVDTARPVPRSGDDLGTRRPTSSVGAWVPTGAGSAASSSPKTGTACSPGASAFPRLWKTCCCPCPVTCCVGDPRPTSGHHWSTALT